LYRSLTRLLFHRRKFSDALTFAEKGLQSMLISLRQGAFLKFKGFDDEARQGLYEMLEDYRAQLRAAVNGASGAADSEAPSEAEDVEAVLDEYHFEFLPFLREEDRELASLFYPEVPDMEEIRALMRPGELILRYQKIRGQILIWVLDSSSVKGGMVRCGPKLLAVLSRLAADPGSIRAGDIKELSAKLIEPVKSYLENARELSLIAAGPLEFLPWAALSFGQGPLIEALPISYLSSLSHYYFSRSKRNLYNARLLAAEFPRPAFENVKKRFASAVNLDGKEGTLDEFQSLRRNYGALHIGGKALLRGADPLASYISLTQRANHFERWRMKDLFKGTANANFIALDNVEIEFGPERDVSPTAPLLQGLVFSGYPGALLRQGVADPKLHEEFLDLFYQDFREGKPAESLRRAQIELARRHPDSLAWTGYRFYGYPGMEGEERRDFAQTHFDENMEKGDEAFRGQDWEAAIGYYENALILSAFLQDVRVQEKDFYNILSEAAFNLKDYPKAIHYQSEALKLAEKENNPEQIAEAVYFLGLLHSRAENYSQAVELLQKALSIYQENGLLDRLAEGYSALGIVEENALDYGQALRAFTASLKINEELGAVLNKGN
ncbi:MAG: CHAT domain-containing protein, partial [Nitrospinales bacterium]